MSFACSRNACTFRSDKKFAIKRAKFSRSSSSYIQAFNPKCSLNCFCSSLRLFWCNKQPVKRNRRRQLEKLWKAWALWWERRWIKAKRAECWSRCDKLFVTQTQPETRWPACGLWCDDAPNRTPRSELYEKTAECFRRNFSCDFHHNKTGISHCIFCVLNWIFCVIPIIQLKYHSMALWLDYKRFSSKKVERTKFVFACRSISLRRRLSFGAKHVSPVGDLRFVLFYFKSESMIFVYSSSSRLSRKLRSTQSRVAFARNLISNWSFQWAFQFLCRSFLSLPP